MELPPTWGVGSPGFELPPDQILPVGRETYAGVAAMLRKLIEVSGNENTVATLKILVNFCYKIIIENEIMIPYAVLTIFFSISGISTTSAPAVTTTTTLPTSAGKN